MENCMIAAIHARLNTKAVDRALQTQAAVGWPGAGSRSAAGVDAEVRPTIARSCAVVQETRTWAGTGRFYTDSPHTAPWLVYAQAARRAPGGTSTRARGPHSRTAGNNWRSVFPWAERNTLPWAYERWRGL